MTIGPFSIEDLSLSGILFLFIVLVFLGLMVPGRTVKRIEKDRDDWRTAYYQERDLRRTADKHAEKLLEGNKTVLNVLKAIFDNTERLVDEHGGHEEHESSEHTPPT